MKIEDIKNQKFLARGKRGEVYTGNYNGTRVAIKRKRKESMAIGRIEIESRFLQLLNKYWIGPRYIGSGEDFVVYEFVEGEFIVDYIKKADRKLITIVLKKVFEQLYKMDTLGINKEEMHHPVKHIIVGNEPVMIDFERCSFTEKPHNITQFCQFLTSSNLTPVLKEKKIFLDTKNLRELSTIYKNDISEKNYRQILEAVMNAD